MKGRRGPRLTRKFAALGIGKVLAILRWLRRRVYSTNASTRNHFTDLSDLRKQVGFPNVVARVQRARSPQTERV